MSLHESSPRAGGSNSLQCETLLRVGNLNAFLPIKEKINSKQTKNKNKVSTIQGLSHF